VNDSELERGTVLPASAGLARSSRGWPAVAELWIALVIGIFFAVRIVGSGLAAQIWHSLLAHH
jgi:hypothetical protein